jgi:predicted unusual protein kinase regulating ubiquinone biosynthesis (AarF/ABC1/UbiB family)
LNVGKTVFEVSKTAAANGLFVPSELTLLGKTLLQLDEVGTLLDPGFDPSASIRRDVHELMTRRLRKDVTSTGDDYDGKVKSPVDVVRVVKAVAAKTGVEYKIFEIFKDVVWHTPEK